MNKDNAEQNKWLYDEESTAWLKENEMLIRKCSHKYGFGNPDDWFAMAVIHIPKIMKKWREKNPVAPIKNTYIITALKNKAKDQEKYKNIHNAEYAHGLAELDEKILTTGIKHKELTQQLFIDKQGHCEIVESLDGQINNRLTLGIVNQVYLQDAFGQIEILEIN